MDESTNKLKEDFSKFIQCKNETSTLIKAALTSKDLEKDLLKKSIDIQKGCIEFSQILLDQNKESLTKYQSAIKSTITRIRTEANVLENLSTMTNESADKYQLILSLVRAKEQSAWSSIITTSNQNITQHNRTEGYIPFGWIIVITILILFSLKKKQNWTPDQVRTYFEEVKPKAIEFHKKIKNFLFKTEESEKK